MRRLVFLCVSASRAFRSGGSAYRAFCISHVLLFREEGNAILGERYQNPGLVLLALGGGGVPWEGTLGNPRDPMGGEPLGGIPWEGTQVPNYVT